MEYYVFRDFIDNVGFDVLDIFVKCGILLFEEFSIIEDYDVVSFVEVIVLWKFIVVVVVKVFSKCVIIVY